MSERVQFAILVFGVFFGALAVSVTMGMLFVRFLALIQMKHPDKWDMLGRPVTFPASIRDTARLGAFIIGREYVNLNDRQLNRIGDSLLIIFLLFVLLAFALKIFTA